MLLSGHKFRKAVNTAKIVSVFSLLNSAVNMTLPAFAAERRAAASGCGAAAARRPALSMDIFCAYGAQQQMRAMSC